MPESTDNIFMRRCLDLALKGEGMTYPNPVVGSVIVYDGVIIGEGYHLKAGKEHAEVNAINSVKDKSLLSKSTLYVSLEPCSHTGKTPPCADLIISKNIPKVVIGTRDTSVKVSGKGISRLRKGGCEVIYGVLDEECRRINRRFFTFHEKRRPYITLKWAQSADGFIDIKRKGESSAEPNWITGKSERVLVHKWRSEEEAILVGAGTIRADNPSLNVRYWKGNNPQRIVLSRKGEIDKYLSDNETNGTVIVFTSDTGDKKGRGNRIILKDDYPASVQVAEYLYNKGIQSLFIEGGEEVLNHFIDNGLWDEARIFKGHLNFNEGVKAPAISGLERSVVNFEKSSLTLLVK